MKNVEDPVGSATFCTVSNARFFIGTVALLNSLRLTGHRGKLIVLDAGLLPVQVERLSEHCRIVEFDAPKDNPTQLKPFAARLEFDELVMVIDSDVIVTGHLTPFLEPAATGAICAVPDPDQFFFPEWEQLLELKASPTPSTYVCAACVSFDPARWRPLLNRWWELSSALDPAVTLQYGASSDTALAEGDQAVLNALLMSEVDRSLVSIVRPELCPLTTSLMHKCEIVDISALACTNGGTPTVLLHHGGAGRKPWEAPRANAYAKLLPRVLLWEDVTLRMDPRELKLWLRPGMLGFVGRSTAHAVNSAARLGRRVVDSSRLRTGD